MTRRPVRKQRTLEIGQLRFASGLRLLSGESATSADTSIFIDLIRPWDLVNLAIEVQGCTLITDRDGQGRLAPVEGANALLIVRFPFQHVSEEAIYERPSGRPMPVPDEITHEPVDDPSPVLNNPGARPNPPIRARAAHGSRLVFEIPSEDSISFTTEGLLEAIGRLKPVVHKLAQPGTALAAGSGLTGALTAPSTRPDPLIRIPGGLIAEFIGNDVVLRKPSARERDQVTAETSGLAMLQQEALIARRARAFLASRAVNLARGVDPPDTVFSDVRIGGRLFAAHSVLGALPVSPIVGGLRRRQQLSSPPLAEETAIEAPYRLIISPDNEARWGHAVAPVGSAQAPGHIELWHSRLGRVATGHDGREIVDETPSDRRIVRAIWTRDRDYPHNAAWKDPRSSIPAHGNDDPFRMSLDPADRNMIVRQTSETLAGTRESITPSPVAAHSLWLSSLGAWLDLHGAWSAKPYSSAHIPSILSWDHVAPMGRDQYVRVVYPGYLCSLGHQATIVKVTERKMKDASPSVASLYQQLFLVIGERRRVYPDTRNFPFRELIVGPQVIAIDEPSGAPGDRLSEFFWPKVGGQPVAFTVEALDHDGQRSRLQVHQMWVSAAFGDHAAVEAAYNGNPLRSASAYGQRIAFVPSRANSDTAFETETLRFIVKAGTATSQPSMSSANIKIAAIERLSRIGSVPIAYHSLYKAKGFGAAANKGEIWARVLVAGEQTPENSSDPSIALPQIQFGAGAPSGSDKSGGFLTPDLPVRGLSRLTGVVGELNEMAKLEFAPQPFFENAAPKLFGLIPLDELSLSVDSDLEKIPQLISEVLSRTEALIDNISRAGKALGDAIEEAGRMAARAAGRPDEWAQQAQAAIAAANDAKGIFDEAASKLPELMAQIQNSGKSGPQVATIYEAFKSELEDAIAEFDALADKLPPFIGHVLRATGQLLRTAILETADLVEDIYRYVNGMAETGTLARIRFEWTPKIGNWPPMPAQPLIEVRPDSLSFAIQARAGFDGKAGMEVLAELSDFKLHLFPNAELIIIAFDHFSFKSGDTGKPLVDIVIADIGFRGVLCFVEDIKELIPLDGFSDPPNIAVTPEGLTAGFSVALPDIAMGLFSITNMSLGADVRVPFLGEVVTVGFNFCTRERPFTIAVAFLGGGGWCGIRISAEGVDVLEVGLEAGACIAVNFGVASGSVGALLGIYIRLESEAGSIAGYFRLRGEVDVLGLISTGIELYMELMYNFDSGKMVGRASITVNVSVLGISKSVHLETERSFAGSNGDPSFLEVMDAATGTSLPWSLYCSAFAGE